MIHETTDVSPEALLGENVQLWHNVQVREHAVIGNDSSFGKNTYVGVGVKVGKNCKVQNNVSLYKGVVIKDAVFIGPHVVFTNDLVPRAMINGKPKTAWDVMESIVNEGASIGAKVTVLPGVTIGKYAMVGAGSVVTKDVPDYGLMYGNPAVFRGWVCECGKQSSGAGVMCGGCQ